MTHSTGSGQASTDRTYTGQRDVTGTGLMDYNFRMYSPTLGRFISPDSIIPGIVISQSWNRYSYVLNNPINANDPSGHKCIGEVGECLEIDKKGNSKPINGAGPKPPTYGNGKIGPPEPPKKPNKEPSEEVKKQMQFCSEHPRAPECTPPEEDTLTQTNHFTPIFPWQLNHLDAFGLTVGLTACKLLICVTGNISLIQNLKWNDEITLFATGGGGFGLGWGKSGSAGCVFGYDVEYNKELAGGAANYGVNLIGIKGGQVTYSVGDSPGMAGNYPQTYTVSGGWGDEASGHAYQTFSIPMLECGRLHNGCNALPFLKHK